ncbi:MAG: toll/interleukin-1 receptor domain-containing protein [Xanthomonadales bacterium]|nr:toll/interleukin-1 receptor domain-containing protein [Xanthomonadales bacterium]
MTDGQPAQGFRYWAFISYSHADAAWAAWLHRALESYRIPGPLVGLPIAAGTVPTRLRPLFRDRDELPTSADLGYTIEEALRQSWCLVVVCSPAAARSRWVDAEVAAFRALGRGERIHCLIVDGEPGSADLECFPPALAASARADGRRGSEPIGADVRPHGDGRSNARLKLVAGILGLGFDKFIRREQQRRHRVMLLVTVASMLAAVLFATFAIVTITSRRDADAQRRHAEGLVEFMLGDLRRKLEPDGKLATLDAVGKEALAYYAAQDPASLDADALARRARALQQIGEVYNLRGQLDDALGVFRQAAATTAELLAREPDNGQRIFDHAQSVYWVGYIAYQRGDHASAEPQFQQYKTLAERLVAIDPANEAWQAEVGYANSNLGTLLLAQGRVAEAISLFDAERVAAKSSVARAPGDINRIARLGQAHAWLADASFSHGEVAAAAEQRRAEIALYERALVQSSKPNVLREALATAERTLARILAAQGDTALSEAKFQRAVELADDLVSIDRDNVQWAESAAEAQIALAEQLPPGEQKESAAIRAGALAGELVQRDQSVGRWQLLRARATLLDARLRASRGEHLEALRLAEGVVQTAASLADVKLLLSTSRPIKARALMVTAAQYRALGRISESVDAWLDAADLLKTDAARGDPYALADRVLCLQASGHDEEAKAGIARLRAIGFKDGRYIPEARN